MIVECNQCHAKFRLDDTKITDKGVKVRCSKCKHIFTVTKDDVADKTLVVSDTPPAPKPPNPKPAAPPPPATPPPKPIEDDGLQGFEFKDEPDAPPAGQGFDDGLGDLNFEEPPPPPPEEPSKAPPPDTDFGDFASEEEKPAPEASGDMDDFGDFDFDDDISAESDTTSPPPAAKQESKDFVNDMPDFGDSESAPAPQAAPSEPAGTDAGSDDFGADDFGGEDFDIGNETAPLPSQPAAPPPPGGGEGIDEFGEISFDDAGGGAAKPPPSGPPPKAQQDTDNMELDTGVGGRTMDEFKQVAGAEDSYAFNAGGSELPETDIPTARSQSRSEEREAAPPPPMEHPKAKAGKAGGPPKKKRSKKPIVAIIILLLVGAGLFQLNKTGKLDDLKKLSLKDLSFEKIQIALGLKKKELPRDVWEVQVLPGSQGFYSLKRADGETLWVIRGTVTSRFIAGQRAVLVEGKVKDGDEVRSAQGVVGAKLTNDNLKTMKMEKIKEDLSSPVDENLEPRMLLTDKTLEFIIVFDNVTSPKPQLAPPGAQVVSSVPL